MRKFVYLSALAGALVVFSCQQKPAEQPAQQTQPQEQAQQQPAQQPQAEQKPAEQGSNAQTTQATAQASGEVKDMTALAQQKGCFACHDMNNKKVGPAFKEVAKRFAGQPNIEEELAKRIKNGGVGVWGQVPMPPQNVTEQEARDLARWILSLK